jgi:hypothetical protein
MQYVKHYYVDDDFNTFCCEVPPEPKYKRHPWKEYPGLDVKIWLADAEDIDVCLSELPDSTPVSTIVADCGKKSIQVLTEVEYNSVAVPYFEADSLFEEARIAREEGNDALATQKESEGNTKRQEALIALYEL